MALPSTFIGLLELKVFVDGVDPSKFVSLGEYLGVGPTISAEISKEQLDTTHKQVVTGDYLDNNAVLCVRSGNRILCATDNFILLNISESDQERFSMVYTLGDPVIRGGMGRKPRMFAYNGVLVDTEKYGSGVSEWKLIYDKYLRGYSCIRQGAIIELRFRDQYRKGYITSCNMPYDANNPQASSFSFTMFVIEARQANGST